ncbi:DUF4440 domain-containing protein [Peribacillus deserti]|uniref:DUF4440 domain-containing protein n=1 Tax=Peribacillus deserti TaxID=673318 RepID=A0A2N5LZY2_9BACI|nr:DUF4440 domain-containing protein [Peribacillus deserti]PLT27625.1 DUF4440 domain-containing protein [Peribacillus deserti]
MEEIERVINDYFNSWNEGFVSKNGDGIRNFMSKDFTGYWSHSSLEKPDSYDYHYDLNEVLKKMDNAEKSFTILSAAERKNGDEFLVLGRETNVISGKPYFAQCMFVWTKENNQWKLRREYIELER